MNSWIGECNERIFVYEPHLMGLEFISSNTSGAIWCHGLTSWIQRIHSSSLNYLPEKNILDTFISELYVALRVGYYTAKYLRQKITHFSKTKLPTYFFFFLVLFGLFFFAWFFVLRLNSNRWWADKVTTFTILSLLPCC